MEAALHGTKAGALAADFSFDDHLPLSPALGGGQVSFYLCGITPIKCTSLMGPYKLGLYGQARVHQLGCFPILLLHKSVYTLCLSKCCFSSLCPSRTSACVHLGPIYFSL
jgi:hypothetical protein